MKINVRDVVGENAITLEDGEKIYQVVYPELSTGKDIEIDFSGVKVFASPFFNAAIGKLLKDVKAEQLAKQLQISNLAPSAVSVLRRVIENSKKYYLSGEAGQKAVDGIVSREFSDR